MKRSLILSHLMVLALSSTSSGKHSTTEESTASPAVAQNSSGTRTPEAAAADISGIEDKIRDFLQTEVDDLLYLHRTHQLSTEQILDRICEKLGEPGSARPLYLEVLRIHLLEVDPSVAARWLIAPPEDTASSQRREILLDTLYRASPDHFYQYISSLPHQDHPVLRKAMMDIWNIKAPFGLGCYEDRYLSWAAALPNPSQRAMALESIQHAYEREPSKKHSTPPEGSPPAVIRPVPAAHPVADLELDRIRTAWEQLPSRELKKDDRLQAQKELLRSWAQKDLEGALRAAAEECTTTKIPFGGSDLPSQLSPIFEDAFTSHPGEVAEMIRDERLGILGTRWICETWIVVLVQNSPGELIRYLPSLKGDEFRNAIGALCGNLTHQPELLRELWQQLHQLQDWHEEDPALLRRVTRTYASALPKEEIRGMMASSNGSMQALAYRILAIKLFPVRGEANYTEKPVDFPAELQGIPENFRTDFASKYLIYQNTTEKTPDTRESQQAMQMIINHGEWDLLLTTMKGISEYRSTERSANLIVTQPPQPQLIEIYKGCMTTFFLTNKANCWKWISQLQNSEWKDRGYAEYAMISLRGLADQTSATMAIKQIKDPAIKAEVDKRKRDWEKQQQQ